MNLLKTVFYFAKQYINSFRFLPRAFITTAIFLFIQQVLKLLLIGFIAGIMMTVMLIYDFISFYSGIIIFVKLSLILYAKLIAKNLAHENIMLAN